jgi:hypothetical protein
MAEQEEIKRRGRPAKVEDLQPVEDKIAKALSTPENTAPRRKAKAVKKDVKTIEVLIQTPTGRLDKKTYETYRSNNASYRRLIKLEKGVRG